MANLTPEQLARIQAYYAAPTSGSGWSPNMATPYQEGGQVFQQDGGFINAYDPNKQQAGQDQFSVYNPDGTFSNQGTFKTDDAMQTFMMMLAAAGGMSMLGAGAGAAGGSGGGSGAFLGEGAMSGVGPWDAAALQNGVGAVAGDAYLPGMLGADGAAMSTAPIGGMFNPALAGGAAAAGGAAGASGAAGGAGGAGGAGAAGVGGALKSAGGLLGPAATLLGAAAGAQGQKNEQTQSRDIPEWLKPSVMGLLGNTNDLLARQMAPGALAGYDDMQRVGRGLLSAPAAGNGFSLFRGR